MSNFFHKYPYENYHELNLDWILSKIKEFDSRLTEVEKIAKELLEALGEIDGIKARLSEIEIAIADLPKIRENINALFDDISNLQGQIDEVKAVLELMQEQIDAINAHIDDIQSYIDARIAEIYAYVDENDYLIILKINQAKENLQQQIDELHELIDNIEFTVYNSWMNQEVTAQENSDFAFNHLADECLTAEQYDTLGLSAEEYAAFDITSRDYQEFGKDKLHFRWVYSPAYGFKQEINNVLTSIVNFIVGTLSASEYADLDLTAEEYADLDLTSEQYFRYNPTTPEGFVKVDPMGIGLTVGQYSHLTL